MKLRKPIRVKNQFEISGLRDRLGLIMVAVSLSDHLVVEGDMIQISDLIVKRVLKNRRYKRPKK